MHGTIADRRALEREALKNVIAQWNANRLDIFELSEPNEVSYLDRLIKTINTKTFVFYILKLFYYIVWFSFRRVLERFYI